MALPFGAATVPAGLAASFLGPSEAKAEEETRTIKRPEANYQVPASMSDAEAEKKIQAYKDEQAGVRRIHR